MRVVESYIEKLSVAAATLNVDVTCRIVTDAEHMRRFVKQESRSGCGQSFCSCERPPVGTHRFGHEIETQHVG